MAPYSLREAKECCQAPKGACGLGLIACVNFAENPRLLSLSLKSCQGRVDAGKRMVRNSLRQCDLDAKLEARVMDLKGRRELVGGTAVLGPDIDTEGCYESRLGHKLKSG